MVRAGGGHPGEHRHHREGTAPDRAHRARAGRPRLGAAPRQRRDAPVVGGREGRGRGRRRCASTRRPAPTSASSRRSRRAEAAKHYRDVLNPDPKVSKPAEDWLLDNEPQHWSMLHTSLVPTIISAGYRYNVIPSEAKATIDVRLHPDEDQSKFLDTLRAVINDPNVEVRWARDRYRPAGGSRLNTEPFAVLEAEVQEALWRGGAADDGHRRDRHGADPIEGRAVLRHRAGDRHRRRRQGLRRAQRSGADSRERSCTASCGSSTTSSWTWRAPNERRPSGCNNDQAYLIETRSRHLSARVQPRSERGGFRAVRSRVNVRTLPRGWRSDHVSSDWRARHRRRRFRRPAFLVSNPVSRGRGGAELLRR